MRLLLVALAALAFVPGSGLAADPVLTADVGVNDSFAIGIVDASGARLTHLDPGTYTIVVHDRSAIHNFDLFGPGVAVKTDVDAVGDFTFTVTFTDGTYTYVCDAHPTTMTGSFTVGTPPAPAPVPAPTARLAASVGPGARIALRGATGLGAGPAVITVKDSSTSDNFRLVGPGVNRATGVAFRGTVVWKVSLKRGSYVFRSDRHPKLRGGFRVG
jgi:hypothetical protein